MKYSTKAIHVGSEPDFSASGDVVVPIHLATTFARRKVHAPTGGYEYSRTGNPTRKALERNLAALEDGKFGFAYSSGLAATTNIILTLKHGDHIIVSDDVYGGTRRLFTKVFQKFGLEFTFVDLSDKKKVREAFMENTKMIWVESPTNPLMKVIDIRAMVSISRRKGAATVVDNTFASSYFQQPLKLGADVVLHSTTKYLGGHSDTVGGAIVTSDQKIAEKLRFLQNAIGAILSPFDSWLLLRGIKTLAVRMEQHQKNALIVADLLQCHPKVKKVYYPGLKDHQGHSIAKKQMKGFGGVISFELNGSAGNAIKFLEFLKLIHIAESLGAVESLIEHPTSMTHASVSKKEQRKIGLSDGLIRLSVGLEDAADLVGDLSQALAKMHSRTE